MIDRDSLDELAEALREAEGSENSIGTALGILGKISEFDPSADLPKDPKDWFDGRGEYYPASSGINFIPSDIKGKCHDLLVTVCAGKENFYLNTMETISLCIDCHDKIKAVIIATDYWDEKEFNKWRKSAFEALHYQFSITSFLFTPHAGRWIVNPIVLVRKGRKKK